MQRHKRTGPHGKRISAQDGGKHTSAQDGGKRISAEDGGKGISAQDGGKRSGLQQRRTHRTAAKANTQDGSDYI